MYFGETVEWFIFPFISFYDGGFPVGVRPLRCHRLETSLSLQFHLARRFCPTTHAGNPHFLKEEGSAESRLQFQINPSFPHPSMSSLSKWKEEKGTKSLGLFIHISPSVTVSSSVSYLLQLSNAFLVLRRSLSSFSHFALWLFLSLSISLSLILSMSFSLQVSFPFNSCFSLPFC